MEKIPPCSTQMRGNLDLGRVPKIHAETVAKQNKGVLSLVDELIVPHAGESAGRGAQAPGRAVAGCARAVDEHQRWLDSTLVPNAKGDFRIGAELYDQKLAFALDLRPAPRRDPPARRSRTGARARRDVRHRRARCCGKDGAPPLPAAPTERSSRPRSRPRSSSPTPTAPRATRWSRPPRRRSPRRPISCARRT
jgi:hypothetical protein